MHSTCHVLIVHSTAKSVLSTACPAGQNWPFGGLLFGTLNKTNFVMVNDILMIVAVIKEGSISDCTWTLLYCSKFHFSVCRSMYKLEVSTGPKFPARPVNFSFDPARN